MPSVVDPFKAVIDKIVLADEAAPRNPTAYRRQDRPTAARRARLSHMPPADPVLAAWGKFGENIDPHGLNATALPPNTDMSQAIENSRTYNANPVQLKCDKTVT
jgi:hypothetical protein